MEIPRKSSFLEDYLMKKTNGKETPCIERENLETTMLMFGNLSDALEKPKNQKDDSTLTTDSLSDDDDTTTLRFQLEALQEEKARLLSRCNDMEKTVSETRRESGVWKLKMTIAMGDMRARMDVLEEDKQCLTDKCQQLDHKLLTSRMENVSKQNQIVVLENKIQEIEKREKKCQSANPR